MYPKNAEGAQGLFRYEAGRNSGSTREPIFRLQRLNPTLCSGRTGALWSRPVAAVEGAILNGFREVGDGERCGAFEICDGARNFENAVVSACGQPLLLHGALEETFGIGAEFAMCANLAGGHLRVGVDSISGFCKSRALPFSSSHDPRANFGGAFRG
jgi:hypothetical protein